MIALEAEHICGRLAGRRQLPATAVGELEAGARIGPGAGRVPLIGHRDLLRKVQGDSPATECGGAAVGDGNVHLEEGAARVRRRRRARVRGVSAVADEDRQT